MDKSEKLLPTAHNDLINPLLTDNYQITMAYTYFCHNRHNQDSVFEAFFRKSPFGSKENPGQFAIFAGLQEVLKLINNFKFTEEHIEFLRTQLPQNASEEFFNYLKQLNAKDLQISAFREGAIVFPNEPLIRLSGPLGLIQLIETPLLNLLNFPTLIATNASRMKKEAGNDKKCLEFGLRRAQGPDGGMTASRYSYLGGFDGSSNVLAGLKFKIPISGTMAHSYVTSYKSLDQVEEFEVEGVKIKETTLKYRQLLGYQNTNEGELAAFLAYARAFQTGFTCLVDTYNVLQSGVPNFTCVAFALLDAKQQPRGVRLDSGDLAYQSIKTKEMWQELGKKHQKQTNNFIVVASNDINESSLKQLNKQNHQIDAFGIGTQLVTCSKQPALGMVYKLVSLENDPKHKIVATEPSKSTLPGKKTVYRVWSDKSGDYSSGDIICSDDFVIEVGKPFKALQKDNAIQRYQITPTKVEKLLVNVWENGKLVNDITDLHESRQYCQEQKNKFNPEVLDNDKPQKYPVLLSEEYYKFFQQCNEKLIVYQNDL